MNLQLHYVISDITGVSGVTILDAILDGERDSFKLSGLRDHRHILWDRSIRSSNGPGSVLPP